ncbi:MAG: dipeptidyl aminopeptidase/acylaminoacyl-peptidase-like protein [Gemmatimonadetes bacterium]|jgi:dienelactone hydrolase|nr:dipeptidyl aminopeptidase/acylaminoacyl-peptidase-like protein [Gemmatimonadota bacterium]
MARHPFTADIRRTTRLPRGTEQRLDLVYGRETVPALWLTPSAPPGPRPAVLLLHGFSSSKERMAQAIGRALLARGVGSLALDLPFHGERVSASGGIPKNPLVLVGAWRGAVSEAREAVTWLAGQEDVDASRLGILGYSLGGFLALMTAADEPRLRAVALAAAGDLPDQTPYAAMVRGLVDPPRAARKLDGRPLLLVNGRRDTTTRPAQAERLFAAANEPKELVWYEGGHWPPPAAIDGAAEWLAGKLAVGGAG